MAAPENAMNDALNHVFIVLPGLFSILYFVQGSPLFLFLLHHSTAQGIKVIYTSAMNIYFSGLGGVGIGPLVEIARDAGHTIMGSDLSESTLTAELSHQGVLVNIGQDGSFLRACHQQTPIDWFVHTSALPDDHPELLLARELGIRISKRDEFLAYILQEKDLKLIAIAGTHGKTTTTGMMVWLFQQLGIATSYSVGTTLSFGPSGKFDPKSEYFIYECDEYDRNFLQFAPHLSLITSIDYDHPDTYPTELDYTEAFQQFIQQSKHTLLWRTDAKYIDAVDQNAWILDDTLALPVAGEHNRRNATLVSKAAEYLGLTQREAIIGALGTFPGTDRRFEKLGDNLYSDYGHHPNEIKATLQLARELSDHVVLVYQPHQNRRQTRIQKDYKDQFELADETYWLPTYLSREDPEEPILTAAELTQNITNKATVHTAEFGDALWETIQRARSECKLVLCMGAGTIDRWVREKNNAL
jgi:UDP-N-acetylmuramate--alanine ligase